MPLRTCRGITLEASETCREIVYRLPGRPRLSPWRSGGSIRGEDQYSEGEPRILAITMVVLTAMALAAVVPARHSQVFAAAGSTVRHADAIAASPPTWGYFKPGFSYPTFAPDGTLYMTDCLNARIYEVTSEGPRGHVAVFAGAGPGGFTQWSRLKAMTGTSTPVVKQYGWATVGGSRRRRSASDRRLLQVHHGHGLRPGRRHVRRGPPEQSHPGDHGGRLRRDRGRRRSGVQVLGYHGPRVLVRKPEMEDRQRMGSSMHPWGWRWIRTGTCLSPTATTTRSGRSTPTAR